MNLLLLPQIAARICAGERFNVCEHSRNYSIVSIVQSLLYIFFLTGDLEKQKRRLVALQFQVSMDYSTSVLRNIIRNQVS